MTLSPRQERTPLIHLLALTLCLCAACTTVPDPTDDSGRPDTDGHTDVDTDTDYDDTDLPESCEASEIPASTVSVPADCTFTPLDHIPPPEPVWVADAGNIAPIDVLVAAVLDTNGDGTIDPWDAPQILAHSRDGLTIHDGESGRVLRRHDRMPYTSALVRSPDGRTLRFGPTGVYDPGAIHDVDSGELLAYAAGDSEIYYSLLYYHIMDIGTDGKPELVHGAHIWNLDGSALSRLRTSSQYSGHDAVHRPAHNGPALVVTGAEIRETDGTVRCVLPGFDPVNTAVMFGEFDLAEPGAELVAQDHDQSALFTTDCRRLVTGPTLDGRLREPETVDGTLLGLGRSPAGGVGGLLDPEPPFEWVAVTTWWDSEGITEGVVALDSAMNELWRYTGPPYTTGTRRATPLVLADLDGDGRSEVILAGDGGDEGLVALDGATGAVRWRLTDRSYRWLAVADVDLDGHAEMVVSAVRFDEEQGEVGEILLLQGKGAEWAPAQTWWHQTNFVPLSVGPDLSPVSPQLREALGERVSARATLSPRYISGYGASPAVRIVDVCDLDCDDGTLQVTVQVGNLGTEDLLLPVDLVIETRVQGRVEELSRTPVAGPLEAETWREGVDLMLPARLGIRDLTARLEPQGWTPLSVCSTEPMTVALDGAWCD